MKGMTLYDVLPALKRNLKLFIQHNTCSQKPSLSGLDLLEILNITEQELQSQIAVERIELHSKTIVAGGYNKYKNDTAYVGFWADVETSVREILNTVFLRVVTLSTCTKQSPHPMLSKYYSLVLTPMIEHFALFHPESVLVGSPKFFKELRECITNIDVSVHPTDILVANALIKKILTTKKPLTTQQRIAAIKTAVVKLQGINTINIE